MGIINTETLYMDQANFTVGDIVKVTTRDPKAEKVHPVPFEGVIISFRGDSLNKTFTVRKIASGNIAVERKFAINSPLIEKIQLIKAQKVRRAKLYYLRKKKS